MKMAESVFSWSKELQTCWVPHEGIQGGQGNFWSGRSSGTSPPSSQVSSWSNTGVHYTVTIEARHGGARSCRVPKAFVALAI